MSVRTLADIVRPADGPPGQNGSIQLTRVSNQQPEGPSKDYTVSQPLLPPRFQPGHVYPKSLTADDSASPLSQPDPAGFVLLGRLLGLGGPMALAVAVVAVAGNQMYSICTLQTAAMLALFGVAVMLLSSRIFGLDLFTAPRILDRHCLLWTSARVAPELRSHHEGHATEGHRFGAQHALL
eukprot:jgi/Botrbrau1/3520/Bobra.341_2s0047.1